MADQGQALAPEASGYEILALLDYEAENKEDLLASLSRLVIERGMAKESFEQAILQRESEYPTGLPFEHISIAIPHTYPEHVLRPGMVAVRLKKPVTFTLMASEDTPVEVRYVFMLLINNSEKQLFMLQSLMEMCQLDDPIKALDSAQSQEDIISVLMPYINKLTGGETK